MTGGDLEKSQNYNEPGAEIGSLLFGCKRVTDGQLSNAERCRDGRLRDVFLGYRDLLVDANQFHFEEDLPAAQLRDGICPAL
ncbi:hypothetical protein T11_1107 [Trichinella zimbabwensis]|uniref:Uncharacterized protein n=1 Tax=Trichinella zimbabwensis TaxID=268475 RepID=A0A0V1GYI6_9BILA|nr:hypothetical protein T11_1107 [Trichinella zimbabwensis]